MLERLFIRNFALIEKTELCFSQGLNILTGETGTGKSILLGALQTVLGDKITDDLFRSEANTLEVEATFDAKKLVLPEWAKVEDNVLLIQRIADKGKKVQNYLNQHQITQAALSELGDGLVDIHGQHDHQLLLKPAYHGLFLDSFGGIQELRESFSAKLSEYNRIAVSIKNLRSDLAKRKEIRDYTEFQIAEIEQIDLKPGEISALKSERELLASAEKRAEMITRLINMISENDSSILEGLALGTNALEELAILDTRCRDLLETLKEAEIRIDEVWRSLVKYRESIEYSPTRLEEINERLFSLEKLLRKHNLDEEGLLKLRDELQKKLNSIEYDEKELEKLITDEVVLRNEVVTIAQDLSMKRKKIKDSFSSAVENELKTLGMPKAFLDVELLRIEDPDGLYEEEGKRFRISENGLEEIQFLFSANPGEKPKPLSKIASGGELSRIMLALKTVLSRSDTVPVLVFDEIDSGIGGRTAEVVGKKLKELSVTKQVILVTHLHQIARYADSHFRVIKEEKDGRTFTHIEKLTKDGRVEELARMLGGEEISEAVRAHASELIENQ